MNVAMFVRDVDVAELCQLALEDVGHRVTHVAGLGDEIVLPEQTDVLLVGLQPNHDLGVLTALRDRVQIPLVVLSSLGRMWDEIAAFDHGADLYVRIPFSPVSLADEIELLVSLSSSVLAERRASILMRLRALSDRLTRVRGERRLHSGLDRLTPVERQVVALVMEGTSAEDGSVALGMAESTFWTHKGAIRRKLAVRRGESLESFLRDNLSA